MNQKLNAAFCYVLARTKEASTWRGIILVGTAFGAKINEQQSLAIITAGIALAGIAGAMFPRCQEADHHRRKLT